MTMMEMLIAAGDAVPISHFSIQKREPGAILSLASREELETGTKATETVI